MLIISVNLLAEIKKYALGFTNSYVAYMKVLSESFHLPHLPVIKRIQQDKKGNFKGKKKKKVHNYHCCSEVS